MLLLLALNHVLHSLSLKLVRLLLHIDHFQVLLALLFQSPCVLSVSVHMIGLVGVDVLPLTLSILGVLHGTSIRLSLAL